MAARPAVTSFPTLEIDAGGQGRTARRSTWEAKSTETDNRDLRL